MYVLCCDGFDEFNVVVAVVAGSDDRYNVK
jgi:hypothetical protein